MQEATYTAAVTGTDKALHAAVSTTTKTANAPAPHVAVTHAHAAPSSLPRLPPIPAGVFEPSQQVPASLRAIAGTPHAPIVSSPKAAHGHSVALARQGEDVALDTIAADAKDFKEAEIAQADHEAAEAAAVIRSGDATE